MNSNLVITLGGYLLFICLIYYNYRKNYLKHKEVTKYIENLTFSIDTATKDTLLSFPMPLVVIELTGTIIWYNSSFKGIFKETDFFKKNISKFISNFDIEALTNDKDKMLRDVVINGRYYNIFGSVAKTYNKSTKSNIIVLLYFVDTTELLQIKEKYQNEKNVTSIIIIDNYDDLMQSMDDDKRPQILAEIDRKIMQSMAFCKGILKKFERDKYLFIFELKYLKEFEDKKLEILDSIKEINVGNKIPVTLSIGFGLNSESLIENYQYATTSLDIALGRGGDQAVIKNGDKINFFGGKTKELEKRTKVKARVISFALRELIDQCSLVLIMGHENTDIDSLGASLGIYRIVKNRGKEAHIVLNQTNPTIFNLTSKIEKNPEYNDIFIEKNEALRLTNERTLLIVVDTSRPSFTECPELLEHAKQIVVIDHHRRGVDTIKDAVLTYQEAYASSACELVVEILQYIEERIKLTNLESEALYAGIVLDTKNFIFKTGVRTFEAAAFLRRQGVDTGSVKQMFQNDLHSYICISNIVQNAEILEDNIAISECSANLENVQIIAAQAADQLIGLSGITAAFVLSKVNEDIYISGRSFGNINVHIILEKLGGGGHLAVAGAQLKNTNIGEAKERLKTIIQEYVKTESTEKND